LSPLLLDILAPEAQLRQSLANTSFQRLGTARTTP
jgi:hypothetical protein